MINLKTWRLYFGAQPQLEHTVPLKASNPGIIVVAMIQGHPFRLAVDTGSYTIVLFRESQMGWLETKVMSQKVTFQMLGGICRGKQVIPPDVDLGNSRWTNPSGIPLDLSNKATDGFLSVWQLGLKVVHFDFERNLMS